MTLQGEMAEWLKARAWKVRIPQKGIGGSNPSLSAIAWSSAQPTVLLTGQRTKLASVSGPGTFIHALPFIQKSTTSTR